MKTKTLAIMAGLGGSLLLAGTADAAYTGLSGEQFGVNVMIDGTEWQVWRVYANVDNPLDAIQAISGNAVNPIVIQTNMGSFYQNKVFGVQHNIEEPVGFLAADPNLAFDTFVTIGTPVLVPEDGMGNGGPTQLQGFATPGFAAGSLMITNGAWFRTPGNNLTIAGPDLRVLIGQFTFERGATVDGVVRVAGNFDGESTQFIGQTFFLPAPGALALLGLAGIAGGRRRRRAD